MNSPDTISYIKYNFKEDILLTDSEDVPEKSKQLLSDVFMHLLYPLLNIKDNLVLNKLLKIVDMIFCNFKIVLNKYSRIKIFEEVLNLLMKKTGSFKYPENEDHVRGKFSTEELHQKKNPSKNNQILIKLKFYLRKWIHINFQMIEIFNGKYHITDIPQFCFPHNHKSMLYQKLPNEKILFDSKQNKIYSEDQFSTNYTMRFCRKMGISILIQINYS